MIKVLTLYCLFIPVGILCAVAQNPASTGSSSSDIFSTLSNTNPSEGKIEIIQDEAIKTLTLQYIEYHKKDRKIPGYRIRIFSDSGQPARQKALAERMRFSKLYPEITTYLEYETPNFKVYIGDFRTKNEALKMLKMLGKEFRGAFLVPARIVPSKL